MNTTILTYGRKSNKDIPIGASTYKKLPLHLRKQAYLWHDGIYCLDMSSHDVYVHKEHSNDFEHGLKFTRYVCFIDNTDMKLLKEVRKNKFEFISPTPDLQPVIEYFQELFKYKTNTHKIGVM